MKGKRLLVGTVAAAAVVSAALAGLAGPAQAAPVPSPARTVSAGWSPNGAVQPLTTIPSTQFLPNPWTPPGTGTIHDAQLANLKNLQTDYTRLQLYSYFPHQAMGELTPPTATSTSWNFNCMDPLVGEFLHNTTGTRTVNFEFPNWLFTYPTGTTPPTSFDSACGTLNFSYTPAASGLVDPTGQTAAAYMARVYSWYTQGGFRDENGVYHYSGHHYTFDSFEIGNEVSQFEYAMTPQMYTTLYDATVHAIRKINPRQQFAAADIVPLAVSGDPGNVGQVVLTPSVLTTWASYLLNPRNHKYGVTVDAFNWHNYYNSISTDGPSAQWETVFGSSNAGADQMLDLEKQVNAIRDEYSPRTKINVNEFGSFYSIDTNAPYSAYPDRFWTLSGAYFAYSWMGLSHLGVNSLRMSQMLAYPGNAPSVSMMDWETGAPNEHWWTLKLITSQIGSGAYLVGNESNSATVASQLFRTSHRQARLMIVNKTNSPETITLPRTTTRFSTATVVDETDGTNGPKTVGVWNGKITLQPFATAIVNGGTI